MVEPEPDYSAMQSIASWMLECSAVVMPEPRLWQMVHQRGPFGCWLVTLLDSSQITLAEGHHSRRAGLLCHWCSLCGARATDTAEMLHLSIPLYARAGEIVERCNAHVCEACSKQRRESEEENPAWYIEMNQRMAGVRLNQKRKEWEAEHPQRMQPFR